MTQQVRKGYRNHRKGTWAAVLVVLAAALAAVLIGAAGSASGAAEKKQVEASFSAPSPWSPGATVTTGFTIRNLATSQQLGSADLCIPTGFSVKSFDPVAIVETAPSGSPCAPGERVRFRNLALAPGGLGVLELPADSLEVDVPCNASALSEKWELYAKQSNDFNGPPGNNFAPNPFFLGVTYGTAGCWLEFTLQPVDTLGAESVEVTAWSGAGIPVRDVTVTIRTSGGSMSVGVPPVTVTSISDVTDANGVAEFSFIQSPIGGPYQLTASATTDGFPNEPSEEFFVVDKFCDSEVEPTCTVLEKQVGSGTAGSTFITVTQSGYTGTVGILVDGSPSAIPDLCGGGTLGDDFRIEVRPLDGNTEITWRFSKSKRLKDPSNGQTYELCVGSKLAPGGDPALMPFPVANGDGLADQDPNDPGRYWGVLTEAAPSTKCNLSYPYPYPTKIAEYANGADAVQVACFPEPFDPWGAGLG